MASDIDVSIVIPCLNEAQSIALCIDKARNALQVIGISGEVIVADNGSTDGSAEIAARHGARVLGVARKGYGHALRAGIDAARGRFVIMGDADDSYDFSDVPRFVDRWRAGYDVVMGNRFKGGIQPGAMPLHHRYFGNPVLTGVLNMFFRSGIGDAHCGMRGFTKEIYERLDLRTTGMEFASEFVIKAVRLGAQITEIPITLWPDKRGRPPHLRSFRDGWRHLRFMLLYAPNWLFLGPGALLMLVGLGLVLWLVTGPKQIGQVTIDVHTMFFGMLFTIVGAQIIAIGLFAKVFSYSERFAATAGGLDHWLKRVTFEHGLLAGGLLTVAGLVGDGVVLAQWAESGFGPLDELRLVIFWSLFLFLGVQITFASFFLSMLGISRGTFIGDYDLSSWHEQTVDLATARKTRSAGVQMPVQPSADRER